MKICSDCSKKFNMTTSTGTFYCSGCDELKSVSDMIIPCPNCETVMKKKFFINDGAWRWVCPKECENDAVNPTASIREISRGSMKGVLRRWVVKGSGKMSYTVAKWSSDYQGQLFSCSCPAWTRHTPRTDCKHVLKVKFEMVGVVEKKSVDDLKSLAAILKMVGVEGAMKYQSGEQGKSEAGKPVPPKPKTEGRKFR